jgi:hypothetical protein
MTIWDAISLVRRHRNTGSALRPAFDRLTNTLIMLETNHWCMVGRVCSFDDRRPSAPVQLLVWLSMDPDLQYPGLGNDDKILQLFAGTLEDHTTADSAKIASVVLQTSRRFLDMLRTQGGKSLALMDDVVTYFEQFLL